MLPEIYLTPPIVRANLVQGLRGVFADGTGSSRGISNEQDRDRLLELRKLCDVVVTDGETARTENYRVPKVCDLAVITRFGFTPADSESDRKYIELRSSPSFAIQALKDSGYERILLEVGPSLIRELIASNSIDQLCMTNTADSVANLSVLGIAGASLMHQENDGDTTFTVWSEIRAD